MLWKNIKYTENGIEVKAILIHSLLYINRYIILIYYGILWNICSYLCVCMFMYACMYEYVKTVND